MKTLIIIFVLVLQGCAYSAHQTQHVIPITPEQAKVHKKCEYEAMKAVSGQRYKGSIADGINTELHMQEVYRLCLEAHS